MRHGRRKLPAVALEGTSVNRVLECIQESHDMPDLNLPTPLLSAATATQLVRMDDTDLVDARRRAHTRGRPGRSHVCARNGVW